MTGRILNGEQAQQEYEKLKKENRIVFEAIVGSHSYGLNVPESDIDKKFVYIDSEENILKGKTIEQINVTDDYVGYEIGRFIELLGKQNPNISEIAFSNPKFHIVKHKLFQKLIIDNKYKFLSKKVAFSYGAYAHSQIKKANTTSKKFKFDFSGERKDISEFTYFLHENSAIPFNYWLNNMTDLKESELVMSKVNHSRDTYALFYLGDGKNHGIFSKNRNDIKLSSFPKEAPFIGYISINLDAFSIYCREYKEWHEWNSKKNPVRFAENLENDKKYDRKNMMHCHRLLNMCIEILQEGEINVLREKDKDYLLNIRYGKSTYQELVDSAEEKRKQIEELYKISKLPEEIDATFLENILYTFRQKYYKKSIWERILGS